MAAMKATLLPLLCTVVLCAHLHDFPDNITAVCKSTEYCCPDANKCLTPTNTSCKNNPSACASGQDCCPLTDLCVIPGAACQSPCADTTMFCCPDAKRCLHAVNPGFICAADAECGSEQVCCPVTHLCVTVHETCTPP